MKLKATQVSKPQWNLNADWTGHTSYRWIIQQSDTVTPPKAGKIT